ncbi:MAG: hypothetical protein PUP91_21225 [Rhizonema sp. PD37]|nr:hypothetical protein [Rhizonema sp. PD37]
MLQRGGKSGALAIASGTKPLPEKLLTKVVATKIENIDKSEGCGSYPGNCRFVAGSLTTK